MISRKARLTLATVVDWSIIEKRTGNEGVIAADANGDAGESGAARKDVSTLGGAVEGSRNLAIVILDDTIWKVEKSGPSVSDSVNSSGLIARIADSITLGAESPKASSAVNWHVGNRPDVFGVIDEAEVIGSGHTLL